MVECIVCGSSRPAEIFELVDVPVLCNQLWPDRSAASSAPVGDIRLHRCPDCAMIWNVSFDPGRMVYSTGYENALHFSPSFRSFSESLADNLVARFDLSGRTVVEIGCGDGHMLDLLAKRGVAEAVGYDPSMKSRETPFTERAGVEIVPEYFTAGNVTRPFDAVICRHVLEHLDAPMEMLSDLRRAIGARDVPVYFEVPNADWMMRTVSMWDVIYEHVCYWTAPSISAAFRRAGFVPISVAEGYGGQFLMIEARPGEPQPDWLPDNVSATLEEADAFSRTARSSLGTWRDEMTCRPGSAVIWGAGSKGITLGNALGMISALVDLNPRKHELMAPGMVVQVVAPEQLPEVAPDLVLISNALYAEEVETQVRSMGLNPDFGIVAG